jgi:hypothetical protein
MQFDAGEAGADTESGTVSKGQVRIRGAGDVETIGIGERGGVAVSDNTVQQHRVSSADGHTGQLDVVFGVAGQAATAGSRHPQDLFNRALDQVGIPPEGVVLAGVGEQQQGAVVDARHGGFVAGEQQRGGQPGDALVAETEVGLRGDQIRITSWPGWARLCVIS